MWEDVSGPIIEMHRASVVKGRSRILSDVDLRIEQGERIAVLGPNGSGKSSLIKTMMGENRNDTSVEGSFVRIRGEEHFSLFDVRRAFGLVSGDLQYDFRRSMPGDTEHLMVGDQVTIIGRPGAVEEFNALLGKVKECKDFVITGGGLLAEHLIGLLEQEGCTVKLIDRDEADSRRLSRRFNETVIINDSGSDPSVLRNENVNMASEFLATPRTRPIQSPSSSFSAPSEGSFFIARGPFRDQWLCSLGRSVGGLSCRPYHGVPIGLHLKKVIGHFRKFSTEAIPLE